MTTPPWVVVDLSEDTPVETMREPTAAEAHEAQAYRKHVEAREQNPSPTVEDRLTALEAVVPLAKRPNRA